MSNASQVLSHFYTTASGLVAYDADGFIFCAMPDAILAAHAADIRVGSHPYAAVTSCIESKPSATMVPLTHSIAELQDWAEWCEDVVDDAIAECAFEGHGGDVDELHGPPDSLLVRAQMQYTWEVPASAADSVALVNAA